jgi:diguanylate cyclase (GGDEF)-like protein
MTTLIIACGAALAATVVVAAIFLLARRPTGPGNDELAASIAQIDHRMHAMVRDLTQALEQAQAEARSGRVLGELAGTIDLDEVLNRTLDAAGGLPGVDAALVSVDIAGGAPLVAAVGLGVDEPTPSIPAPPDGQLPRSISIEYDHGNHGDDDGQIRAGLAVPLDNEDEHLGYLAVYSHAGRAAFGEHGAADLAELALRAGPAIENARRFREARQLADLDALTGLHNRRYFHEMLAREVARSHRYGRTLALVVFDLDDFKAVNDRIGHLAGDAVLAEAAERVRQVVRSADIACRVGGDEFAVILPESSLVDADQLCRRLEAAISSGPVGHAGRLHLSAGVTEVRPDDTAVSFFERADEALYRAKSAGKGQVVSVAASQGSK